MNGWLVVVVVLVAFVLIALRLLVEIIDPAVQAWLAEREERVERRAEAKQTIRERPVERPDRA